MRITRFALTALVAAMVIFVAASSYSQQAGQQPQAQGDAQAQGRGAGQGAGGRGVQAGPMAVAEQQLQEAQRLTREGRGGGGGGQGRGGQAGVGGGQAPADETPETYVNQYVNTTDLFSASVPCTFTSRDITWKTEYDVTVPGRVYSCRHAPTNTDYEMSVINYTDIIALRRAREHTPAAGGDAYARIDLAASIDYACTRIRNEAAKVTYDAWHYINLIPGHELQTTLANGNRVYSAVYLHEYRLYIMKATVPAMGIPPLLYTQSFAVVRPDGGGIRYPSIYRHPW